jgi:hypothetical protein
VTLGLPAQRRARADRRCVHRAVTVTRSGCFGTAVPSRVTRAAPPPDAPRRPIRSPAADRRPSAAG